MVFRSLPSYERGSGLEYKRLKQFKAGRDGGEIALCPSTTKPRQVSGGSNSGVALGETIAVNRK